MIKNKAYRFRIKPNKEQEEMFAKTFGSCRFIWNKMLSDKKSHYEETKETLRNTPAQYKKEYEWLKEVDSLALCNVQLNLEKAYKKFFREHKGFPNFKSKHKSKSSYTTNHLEVQEKHLKLPKLGEVKAVFHRQIPKDSKLKSVTITKEATGKYYVAILVEYETEINPKVINKVLGLDMSMSKLYVDSENNSTEYPRFYREEEERLAQEQRKLSLCTFRSNNYYKQKHRVNLVFERVKNKRKDFLHKQSYLIAKNNDCVVVEDLNMQGMSQCLKLGKSVNDAGWGMFLEMLRYKLEDEGKEMIKIDKFYPSSKLCSCCGTIKDKLELSERVYECECGNKIDRDYNAAINIRREGIKILKKNRRDCGDSLLILNS